MGALGIVVAPPALDQHARLRHGVEDLAVRHTRSKMWPVHRAVGPSRYFGRSAKAMPSSVSTVWIA
jgi:hypothetical protein